jgi:hypothetical protein
MNIDGKETKFNIGDTVWEVYWDDDIGAFNVCDWVVGYVVVKHDRIQFVSDDGYDQFVDDSDDLCKTSLGAANEAKRRNTPFMEKVEHRGY